MSLTDKIKSLSKINFDDLYNDFLGLERNQQTIVAVGLAIVFLIIVFLPIRCVSSKINEKETEYLKFTKMASQFYGIQQEYTNLKQSFDRIKKASSKLGADPLKRVLYNITDDLGIDRSKITLKTSSPVSGELFTEVGKEVVIKNIRFDQTINLLERLADFSEVPINVKTVTIKADKNNRQLMREIKFAITTIKPSK